jgi:uncharacterized membrane protein YdcZ (DUF606 family)
MSSSFSLPKLIVAIFNGAPPNEDVASYTRQITSLISLYICLVALFLLAIFVRRLGKQKSLKEESKSFWTWMAGALAFSILWVAIYVVYLLATGE